MTDYDYDRFGRIEKITFAVGTEDEAFQEFEYDAAGNQTAFIDENGNRTEFEYDSLNRLVRTIEADPDGDEGPLTSPTTRFEYDIGGNPVLTVDARGSETRSDFDELERLSATIDHRSQTTQFVLDNLGNIREVVDPLGHVSQNVYDARNRVTSTIDPEGGATRVDYDSSNNLKSLTDPVGNVTTFVYDARNRLDLEIDPLGKVTDYDYDVVNNLISKLDRNGRITEYVHDDADRILAETWISTDGDQVNVLRHSYDPNGNLRTAVDNHSALEFNYDFRDRVETVDNVGTPGAPNVVLTYAYDGVGNVTSVSDTIEGDAGATTSYEFDGLNRNTSIRHSGNEVTNKLVDLVYNDIGQFDEIRRYSDFDRENLVAATDYVYDNLNRFEALNHGNVSDPRAIAFYDYEYDSASRIAAITDTDGRTDYRYDDRSQLIGAERESDDPRGHERYEYDANGNREDSHLHGMGYRTGPGNRLESDGAFRYEYDGEGNTVRRINIATGEYREFHYDHRNRLIRVTDFSAGGNMAQEVAYSYDTLGRRISRSIDPDGEGMEAPRTELFVYDRDDVQLDYVDTDGQDLGVPPIQAVRYLFGTSVDQVIAQENAEGRTLWLLTDHLGSVRDIVENQGFVLNHIKYNSFGQSVGQGPSDISTRYLFTGRELDEEVQLFYYRARFLDGDIGRFLSEDPIGFQSRDMNYYRYVGNAPHVLTDPSGTIIPAITIFIANCTANPLCVGAVIGGGAAVLGHLGVIPKGPSVAGASPLNPVGPVVGACIGELLEYVDELGKLLGESLGDDIRMTLGGKR